MESEPEPDASVIRGQRRAFLQHHPMLTDVAMIGEVPDSSLDYDRGIKKRIYARASIPIYWIVNLADRCIEVFTAPTGSGEFPDYLQRQVFGEDDSVPVILDGNEVGRIVMRELLP